jgi:hypothetical protein
MSYALTYPIKYAGLVKGSMLGNKEWLMRHNRSTQIVGQKPGPGGYGAVSLHYLSAVTVSNTTDGTMLANGVSSSVVNGTYVDPNAPLSLTGDQIKSLYTDPDYMQDIAEACGNGIILSAQNAVIAALLAATAAHTETLPTGSANFEVVSANEFLLLSAMAKCVTQMMARFGMRPADLNIAMSATAWANFVALRATGIHNPVLMPDGTYSFMGVPVFVIPGTGATGDNITGGATNFGAFSGNCAYVTSKDSILFVMDDPYVHGGGPIAASDGTTKWITKGPYAYAVVSTFFTEVLNGAS